MPDALPKISILLTLTDVGQRGGGYQMRVTTDEGNRDYLGSIPDLCDRLKVLLPRMMHGADQPK